MKGLNTIHLVIFIIFFCIPLMGSAATSHVFVYEVQTDGITAQDEFVLLYNPTENTIDASNWSIQYKSAAGTKYYKKNFSSDTYIQPLEYFLIAHKNYQGTQTPDMIHASFTLASTGGSVYVVANQTTLTSDTDNSIIDRYTWEEEDAQKQKNTEEQENNKLTNQITTSSNPILVKAPEPELKPYSLTSDPLIIINELLPNPVGIDAEGEWIEIKNADAQEIDMSGWMISDAAKSFTIGSLRIIRGAVVIFKRSETGIALNNSGTEVVTISDSYGNIIDRMGYQEAMAEGISLARNKNNQWETTSTPTPGEENVITKIINQEVVPTTQDIILQAQARQKSLIDNLQLATTTNELTATELQLNYNIIITELLPNPVGSDNDNEWIELYNNSTQPANLDGYILADASGKIFTIKNYPLDPFEFGVITRNSSKLSLNNKNETIKLWAPDGTLLDSTQYITSAKEGDAYALNPNGLWDWTNIPTPGGENVFTQPQENTENNKIQETPEDEIKKPEQQVLGASTSTNQILIKQKPSTTRYIKYFFILIGVIITAFIVFKKSKNNINQQ